MKFHVYFERRWCNDLLRIQRLYQHYKKEQWMVGYLTIVGTNALLYINNVNQMLRDALIFKSISSEK